MTLDTDMGNYGRKTLDVMDRAEWYNKWLIDTACQYLKGEILEVGFGIGSFTTKLSKYGYVTAIDVNYDYIKEGKRRFGERVGFGDIEKGKYFFGKKKFDCIFCSNVLEHIKDDKKAVKNMFNLLKKGGYLVLNVPAHMILYSKVDKNLGHYRRYTTKHLESVLSTASCEIVKVLYINWWAALGWWLFVKVLKLESIPKDKVSLFNFFGKYLLWIEKFVSMPFGLSVFAVAKKL